MLRPATPPWISCPPLLSSPTSHGASSMMDSKDAHILISRPGHRPAYSAKWRLWGSGAQQAILAFPYDQGHLKVLPRGQDQRGKIQRWKSGLEPQAQRKSERVPRRSVDSDQGEGLHTARASIKEAPWSTA